MINISRYIFVYLMILALCINIHANDTILTSNINNKNEIYTKIKSFPDDNQEFNINDILLLEKKAFKPLEQEWINYQYTTSTFWFKFTLTNDLPRNKSLILNLFNPDLDYINLYTVTNNTVIDSVNTGELVDVSSRSIQHRSFIFPVNLNPGESIEYYISINNSGNAFFVPISLSELDVFNTNDEATERINWTIYGLLFFVLLFTIYLYFSTKEKINLFHTCYIVFTIIFLLYYDGYTFFFNPSKVFERIKWVYPSMFVVFMLYFLKEFSKNNNRFKFLIGIIPYLQLITIALPIFYYFEYPYSLVTNLFLPVMILSSILLATIISFTNLNRFYPPSIMLFIGYFTFFLGVLLHQAKELNIISSTLLSENFIKIGFTIQSIITTLAVLERFRIAQEDANKTIQKNARFIQAQNFELTTLNTELEKLSIVASETDNAVAICGIDGKIDWCNSAYQDIYDINLEDMVADGNNYIFNVAEHEKVETHFTRCVEEEILQSFELELETKQSKQLWVQSSLTPYHNKGKLSKIIIIDANITNLKKYQKRLEASMAKAIESDQLKTAFLGNISHEIRTPLNGIIGFSELLALHEIQEVKRRKYIDLIKTNSEQLLHIIDDIMDISLIESDQLRVNIIECRLEAIAVEVIENVKSYRESIGKSHIDFKFESLLPPNGDVIFTDPSRVRQVFANTLRNAFKFTENGYAKLTLSANSSNFIVTVEDTGIGVPKHKKDVIFQRFRQGEETLSREFGGTGAGLPICKGILDKLKGKIWLDTEYTDGAKFCIALPMFQNSIH
ncbi:MAG: ATP-binding protein [Bacteroidales bacterium]|nr:ATP-binding protein [Bacteroidales bacterium]